MILSIQERNKPAYLAAILLLLAGVLRFPFPSNDLKLSTQVCFEFTTCLLMAVWVWRNDKWLALFLCLSLFSLYLTNYSIQSFYAFQAVFYGMIWYSFIVIVFDKGNVRYLMDAIAIIALMNVFFIILQEMGKDPIFTFYSDPTGLCGNTNFANLLLAFSIPAFLRPKWTFGLIAIAGGMVATRTSTGAVSAAIGMIFFLSFHGLFWFGFVGATIATGLYFYYVDFFGLERLPVWEIGLNKWLDHWLFGWGLGRWKVVFAEPMVTGTRWLTPHNEYLQGLFEMGIAFPVLVAGYFIGIFRRFTKQALIPTTALIIIAVSCIGQFPFHIAPTAGIAVTWLAILTVSLKENENARR
ncbi:MAG: O-antigen ligase family protein [FCB group bacterium]|nr:O-antigen ligase family protein [FCB group bacterium]